MHRTMPAERSLLARSNTSMTRPFQFGLKWMLAAPLIVGGLVACLTTDANRHSRELQMGLRLGLMVLSAPIFVTIAQGGRWSRSFAIGAACPAAIGVLIAKES
ncbi:MAG TPA: hypothetical protein VHC22_32800 [Pirellulales bacterium]|nr:hypothetical protein [Pirellulales bacterium]